MRRLFSRHGVGLVCLSLLTTGCGDPFAPPSRIKTAPRASEALGTKPTFLVFVLPGAFSNDLEAWSYRAQHEANDKRAVFRIMRPSPIESAAGQTEIIRKALGEGVSALIVCAGDDPDLPKALVEAEAKGVPVILIDKPVAAPEGSKPFSVVEPAPFEETARQIVEATIKDLKKASRPVDGGAIVLVDQKNGDRTSGRRAEALTASAKAAGFRKVVTVPFDGSQIDSAKLAVIEAVKANPDASVVLTVDGEGLVGGSEARVGLKGRPILFVGGYTDYRASRVVTPPARESCYVEGRFIEMGAQAVLAALARLRGDQVSEHIYVTPKFVKTDAEVVTDANAPSSLFEIKTLTPPENKNGATKP